MFNVVVTVGRSVVGHHSLCRRFCRALLLFVLAFSQPPVVVKYCNVDMFRSVVRTAAYPCASIASSMTPLSGA